jgi:hypothetical protein
MVLATTAHNSAVTIRTQSGRSCRRNKYIALYVDVTGPSASQVVLGGILFTLSLTLGTQRRNLDLTNGKTLQTSKSIPTILSLPIIGNVDHLPLLVQYTLNQ